MLLHHNHFSILIHCFVIVCTISHDSYKSSKNYVLCEKALLTSPFDKKKINKNVVCIKVYVVKIKQNKTKQKIN